MTYEEKREMLGRYLEEISAFHRAKRDAEKWRSWACLPNMGGSVTDTFRKNAAKAEAAAVKTAYRLSKRYWELDAALKRMHSGKLRELLECLYFDGLDMRDAAKEWGYSRPYMNALLRQAIDELEDVSDFFYGESCQTVQGNATDPGKGIV